MCLIDNLAKSMAQKYESLSLEMNLGLEKITSDQNCQKWGSISLQSFAQILYKITY